LTQKKDPKKFRGLKPQHPHVGREAVSIWPFLMTGREGPGRRPCPAAAPPCASLADTRAQSRRTECPKPDPILEKGKEGGRGPGRGGLRGPEGTLQPGCLHGGQLELRGPRGALDRHLTERPNGHVPSDNPRPQRSPEPALLTNAPHPLALGRKRTDHKQGCWRHTHLPPPPGICRRRPALEARGGSAGGLQLQLQGVVVPPQPPPLVLRRRTGPPATVRRGGGRALPSAAGHAARTMACARR